MEACRALRPGLAWAAILSLLAAAQPLPAADGGCGAEYVGGTLGQLGSRVSGKIHITDPEVLLFETKKAGIEIPYDRINLLEYGQQAGRRYLLALAISPILLFSKSRKHFLTVSFKDVAGQQQAMVFQVDKRDVRAVLAGLEARTGLKVDYQDDEARKAGGG
ncbi:MAG: hypothetical protein ACE141_15160 [Bryobacteraceae bacterium]